MIARPTADRRCVLMPAQRGMSLIELIVFIVIVSVALAGVLTSFNLGAGRSADPLVRKQALAVAEAMLEEVLSKDFANPPGGFTPALPGNPAQLERPSFDDVTDYNMTGGWSWTVRSLADVTTDIAGLQAYTVQVVVAPLALAGVAGQQVTVTVAGLTETVTISGFRSDYE